MLTCSNFTIEQEAKKGCQLCVTAQAECWEFRVTTLSVGQAPKLRTMVRVEVHISREFSAA